MTKLDSDTSTPLEGDTDAPGRANIKELKDATRSLEQSLSDIKMRLSANKALNITKVKRDPSIGLVGSHCKKGCHAQRGPMSSVILRCVPRISVCTETYASTAEQMLVATAGDVRRSNLSFDATMDIVDGVVSEPNAQRFWLLPGLYPVACADHGICSYRVLETWARVPVILALPEVVASDEDAYQFRAVVWYDTSDDMCVPIYVGRDSLVPITMCAFCGHKESYNICRRCRGATYCSQTCANQDHAQHLRTCSKRDPAEISARIVDILYADALDESINILQRTRARNGAPSDAPEVHSSYEALYFLATEYGQQRGHSDDFRAMAKKRNCDTFDLPETPRWLSYADFKHSMQLFYDTLIGSDVIRNYTTIDINMILCLVDRLDQDAPGLLA